MGGEASLAVVLENEADAAQLRTAIKASDGADEVAAQVGTVSLGIGNPFNILALWSTDFPWSPEALRAAFETLVPIARSALHLHTRSHRGMMMRFMRGAPGEPHEERDAPRST